jgi:hypothetical protein
LYRFGPIDRRIARSQTDSVTGAFRRQRIRANNGTRSCQPASQDTVLGLIVRLFCSPDDFWIDELDLDDPLAI